MRISIAANSNVKYVTFSATKNKTMNLFVRSTAQC